MLARKRAVAGRPRGGETASMKTAAFGKSKPEIKAENIEGHAQNRRVVFVPVGVAAMQINPQKEDLQLKGDPAARRPAHGGAKGTK